MFLTSDVVLSSLGKPPAHLAPAEWLSYDSTWAWVRFRKVGALPWLEMAVISPGLCHFHSISYKLGFCYSLLELMVCSDTVKYSRRTLLIFPGCVRLLPSLLWSGACQEQPSRRDAQGVWPEAPIPSARALLLCIC